MDRYAKQPSRLLVSDCAAAHCFAFPNHSDEIVQDLHLFPFYPLALRPAAVRGTVYLCILFDQSLIPS